MKRRTWEILDTHGPDPFARTIGLSIVVLIIFNVAGLVMETVPGIDQSWGPWFDSFETFSVLVFTLEYLLRLYSCTEDPAYAHPIKGRLKFFFRPLTLIDLLAVLPWWLPHVHADLRFIRAMRILRIFRILKLARYVSAVSLFTTVLRRTREEMVISFAGLLVLLILASSGMYYLEHEAQPENFSSIPASMWWAVVTLTTVGYGDVFPKTPPGRFLAGFTALLGVCTLAIPTGILAGAFTDELRVRREAKEKGLVKPPCPHCGKRADEPVAGQTLPIQPPATEL